MLKLRNLIRRQRKVTLELVVAEVLEQVIGAVARAGLLVFDHEIGEFVHVPRGLENNFGSDAGAIDFEHVLFQDEVLAPEREHVGLDGAAGRAVVEEAGDAAVDLEGGDVEEAPFKGVHHGLTEGLAAVGAAEEGVLDGAFFELQRV